MDVSIPYECKVAIQKRRKRKDKNKVGNQIDTDEKDLYLIKLFSVQETSLLPPLNAEARGTSYITLVARNVASCKYVVCC